jgi:transcriptional regulator of acetoin/glycerol metabolism
MKKPGITSEIHKPSTNDEWLSLEFEIVSLFGGAPVDDEQLFAGRTKQILKMLQTVMERSKHIVLFGEAGVGKTSLSNIFWKRYHKTLRSFVVARVQAGPQDTFSSLWIRAIEELKAAANGPDRADDEGFFKASDVVEPYSAIMRDQKRIAHFEKHLRRFSSAEAGDILIKRGGERQQTFRFADPMMQPYVIIRGIQSDMIDESAKSLLLQREQGEFFPI